MQLLKREIHVNFNEYYELKGFYRRDRWDFREHLLYELPEDKKNFKNSHFRLYDFTKYENKYLVNELKFYLKTKLELKENSVRTIISRATHYQRILDFMDEYYSDIKSIIQVNRDTVFKDLSSYAKGKSYKDTYKNNLVKTMELKRCNLILKLSIELNVDVETILELENNCIMIFHNSPFLTLKDKYFKENWYSSTIRFNKGN